MVTQSIIKIIAKRLWIEDQIVEHFSAVAEDYLNVRNHFGDEEIDLSFGRKICKVNNKIECKGFSIYETNPFLIDKNNDNNNLINYECARWNQIFKNIENEPHSGDCTNMPWTCTKCIYEEYIKKAQKILFDEI